MNVILIRKNGEETLVPFEEINVITPVDEHTLCVSLGEKGDVFCELIISEL